MAPSSTDHAATNSRMIWLQPPKTASASLCRGRLSAGRTEPAPNRDCDGKEPVSDLRRDSSQGPSRTAKTGRRATHPDSCQVSCAVRPVTAAAAAFRPGGGPPGPPGPHSPSRCPVAPGQRPQRSGRRTGRNDGRHGRCHRRSSSDRFHAYSPLPLSTACGVRLSTTGHGDPERKRSLTVGKLWCRASHCQDT